MKLSHGFYFPDYDTHFPKMLEKSLKKDGVSRYQWRARDYAVSICKKRRNCIDIGANVGLWSCDLVKSFSKVLAFEPVDIFRECFKLNIKQNNYELYPVALGKIESMINMTIVEGNTGHSHVSPESIGKGSIPLKLLDSYGFHDVDLIKIDVEGLEEDILEGAKDTIKNNRPVIVVEQQTHEYKDAKLSTPSIKILESWGYIVRENFSKDWILSYPD